MYIEFYGVPGSGKTTFADLLNKSLNKDPRWKNSPRILCRTYSAYLKFLGLVLLQFFKKNGFRKGIVKRPVHFAAFLKGVFVRFLIETRHEQSGLYISDHGIIQTFSQNAVFRKQFIKNKAFRTAILNIIPRTKNTVFIYLKSMHRISKKRILSKGMGRLYSEEFLFECKTLFDFVAQYFNSDIISTNLPKSKIRANIIKIFRNRSIFKQKEILK